MYYFAVESVATHVRKEYKYFVNYILTDNKRQASAKTSYRPRGILKILMTFYRLKTCTKCEVIFIQGSILA